MAAVGDDVVEAAVDHAGHRLDRLQSASQRPAAPLREKATSPALDAERPQVPQILLDGPGTGSLQITSSEEAELGPTLGMDVLLGGDPQVLRALETVPFTVWQARRPSIPNRSMSRVKRP